jgi:hypothetical protein
MCSLLSSSIVNTDLNNLNGTLPSELYALTSLQHLSVQANSLYGTIPSSLGQLNHLQILALSQNRLSGSLPESLLGLPKLEKLIVYENQLTGSVPKLFSPSLEVMFFSNNFLTGTISDSNLLENMQYLLVDSNLLSGSIPESIFTSKLESLSLWDNRFSGSLTSKVGRGVELDYLDLSNNDLTGTIPSEIGSLINLEALYLSWNSFIGTIPSKIGSLTRLHALQLDHNQLSGTLPVEFLSLSHVSLWLSVNNITGSLDMVCNQTDSFPFVDADCGGADPKVECSCCVNCCHSRSKVCLRNETAACLAHRSQYDRPKGPEYVESAGTICDCITPEFDGLSFSCKDTLCQSCNLDGTVCSMNKQYQRSYRYDEDIPYDYKFQATYQYVVGRNDTVTLETTILPDTTWTCEVTVNGQFCNGCHRASCRDGFRGINIECTNVEGAGLIDICDETRSNHDGPLLVFAFQDSRFLQGCPPRF